MKALIIHDSKTGNGEKLAMIMAEKFSSAGWDIDVSHVQQAVVAFANGEQPNVIITGAAVRAFTLSGTVKRWLDKIGSRNKSSEYDTPYGAVFITHAMSREMINGYAKRLMRRAEKSGAMRQVFPEWFSGRVEKPEGPFITGTLEKAEEFAQKIIDWCLDTK